jgi:hypothetical protein
MNLVMIERGGNMTWRWDEKVIIIGGSEFLMVGVCDLWGK